MNWSKLVPGRAAVRHAAAFVVAPRAVGSLFAAVNDDGRERAMVALIDGSQGTGDGIGVRLHPGAGGTTLACRATCCHRFPCFIQIEVKRSWLRFPARGILPPKTQSSVPARTTVSP